MGSFIDYFFSENEAEEPKKLSEEDLFKEATNIDVPSLKAFTAWLVLNNHLKPTVKLKEDRSKVSVFSLNPTQRVLYLVKNVPQIKELAKQFSFKWRE